MKDVSVKTLSRLRTDGTLVWTKAEGCLMFKGGFWIPVEGFTVGTLTDSIPLDDSEIAALISSGIFSKEFLPIMEDISEKSGSLSRLRTDGTLVWLKDDGSCLMFKGGCWVPAEGFTVGTLTDSVPLEDLEITNLISAGVFS